MTRVSFGASGSQTLDAADATENLSATRDVPAWMAGTSPAMTTEGDV
jgi:hypothetical protein